MSCKKFYTFFPKEKKNPASGQCFSLPMCYFTGDKIMLWSAYNQKFVCKTVNFKGLEENFKG